MVWSITKTPIDFGSSAFVGPLDAFAAPAAVYWDSLLLSAYEGPAFEVREATGDTLLDINYLADGSLDTASLLAHCGAGDGFVSKWYDQSGNARHVVQATAANQPRIVASGVVDDGVQFLDATDVLTAATYQPATPNFTALGRIKRVGSGLYAGITGFGFAANKFGMGLHTGQPRLIRQQTGWSTLNGNPTLAVDTWGIVSVRGSGNASWDIAWAGFVGLNAAATVAQSLAYAETGVLGLGIDQGNRDVFARSGFVLWESEISDPNQELIIAALTP